MTTDVALRIGSRASTLAMVQARIVRDGLETLGIAAEIVAITTDGDVRAADTAWGEGAFVSAIERALADGRIDLAVHSAKDVPTDVDPGLTIAAYLPREDPRDALVLSPATRTDRAQATGLDAVPEGARVGTDSPRRSAFLLARAARSARAPASTATSTRGCAGSTRARPTRSCWPRRA